MSDIQSLISFMGQQSTKILQQTLQHIGLTFISLAIAVLIGLPLGIFISRRKRLSGSVLGFAGVLQTIPSIALLGFMIPLLGIGALPAIAALFLYALLPIIRNTYTGISSINANIREAAIAMGMNPQQVLMKVELPLAFPVIMAGIRTATVINVGVATLAAYIAAGGLGEFIFGGIALNNSAMILAGAIPAALLALLLDFLLGRLQKVNWRKQRALRIVLPGLLLICCSFYIIPAGYSTKLKAGFTPEFMGRRDGDLGLKERYKLNINTVVISDAVMYKAVHDSRLDVISGYSTDGRLKAYDLVTLVDDKSIFPPYYAAPLISEQALQRYPELEDALNLLAGHINDSIMTDLNYRADYLKQSPERVAADFLKAQGLYMPARTGKKGTVRMGSKIFTEQYILTAIYTMLIRGYTDLDVAAKTGLGGTKICFDALTNDEIDFYPEYTGTGLLVLLQPNEQTVSSIIADKDKVYAFVQNAFHNNYHLKWLRPIGFNNAYALMMRRKQSTDIGIKTISELSTYLHAK